MLFEYLRGKLRRFVRNENGGAIAELAIMVPFLVIMLAAVTEVGRFFQTYTTLAKATRSSARYLSNHSINTAELDRAASLVVCGKLACAEDGGDETVKGIRGGPPIAKANVCIETTATTVTVRIPRTANCNPVAGAPAGNPYNYQPIFNLGALLGVPSFQLGPTLSPRTTMFKPAV